jgi:hypothetical protein
MSLDEKLTGPEIGFNTEAKRHREKRGCYLAGKVELFV